MAAKESARCSRQRGQAPPWPWRRTPEAVASGWLAMKRRGLMGKRGGGGENADEKKMRKNRDEADFNRK